MNRQERVIDIIRQFQKGVNDLSLARQYGIEYRDFTYLLMAYRAVGDKNVRASWNKRPMIVWLKEKKNMKNEDLARMFGCSLANVNSAFRDKKTKKEVQEINEQKELSWLNRQNAILKRNEEEMRKGKRVKKVKKQGYTTLPNRKTGSGVVFLKGGKSK